MSTLLRRGASSSRKAEPTLTRSPLATPNSVPSGSTAAEPSPKPAKKKKASGKKKSKKKGAKTSREEAELEDDFDEARWLEQQMELTRRMNTMYCANSDTGGGCDADQEEEEDDEDEEEDPLESFDHDAAAEQEAVRKAETMRLLYQMQQGALSSSSSDVGPHVGGDDEAIEAKAPPARPQVGRVAVPPPRPVVTSFSKGASSFRPPKVVPSSDYESAVGKDGHVSAVFGGGIAIDSGIAEFERQFELHTARENGEGAADDTSSSSEIEFEPFCAGRQLGAVDVIEPVCVTFPPSAPWDSSTVPALAGKGAAAAATLTADAEPLATPRTLAQRVAMRRQASFDRRRSTGAMITATGV